MKPTKRNRTWRYLLGAALLALVALAIWRMWFMPAPPEPPPTAVARVGNIQNTVLAAGTLEARNLVSVGAQASGQLKHLAVQTGDRVQAGDLIAEIDSMTQQNALRTAEAALRSVKARQAAQQANLKRAQREFERQRQMLARQASSQQAFEEAEAALATIEAEVAALEAELAQAEIAVDTARVNLGYTRITAPMSGTIVAEVAKEGQTLNAAQQAPTIVRMAQLDELTVKAEISEADVIRVQPGMPVYFSILGEPGRRFHATLRAIEPAPESIATESTSAGAASSSSSSTSSAVYYNGLFEVPNPDGLLRIGMTAQVNIVLAEAEHAVLIPASAVQPLPDASQTPQAGADAADTATTLGPAGSESTTAADDPGRPAQVRVLHPDGRIETREIRVGIDNNVQVEVLAGLEAGEKVVIGGTGTAAAPPARSGRPPRLRL